MARPCLLTPELHKEFVQLMAEGNFAIHACSITGTQYRTYKKWMQRGLSSDEEPYASFAHDVRKARAGARRVAVQCILTAAKEPRHWTAAAWFLERTDPEHYARRDGNAVSVQSTGAQVTIAPNEDPKRVRDKLRAEISKLTAAVAEVDKLIAEKEGAH